MNEPAHGNGKAPIKRQALKLKGDEASWQFVNGPWKTNAAGDLISPASSHWSMDTHFAFYTAHAYRDCVISGKFQQLYVGGKPSELIVRSPDSRRFYAIHFNRQTYKLDEPFGGSPWAAYTMVSLWKSHNDGYRRMMAYRRKVGRCAPQDPDNPAGPTAWESIRVECFGPEILVYYDDTFVLAVKDDDYPAGVVGVSNLQSINAWKDLAVEGSPVTLRPAWTTAETETPRQFAVGWDPQITKIQSQAAATLLPNEEILVGFDGDGKKRWVTRSRDFGLTWDPPRAGRFGYYIRSLDELWEVSPEQNPEVEWSGKDLDQQVPDNWWSEFSRSEDCGETWARKERLNVPFPAGRAYAPRRGKAGSVLTLNGRLVELSDGSVGMTGFWRNNRDGSYASDQVQFVRTTDGGKTWSISPVDANEWQRNESSFVELEDGELLCLMRSNYTNSVGASRSRDRGATWSTVRPAGIPFFGSSVPGIMRTRDNVLVLAVRSWGIFTSVDRGYTWSLPTHIRGYHGSGVPASLLEMRDGRILVLNANHANAPDARIKAQFIRVDRDGSVHPARPGPKG